MKSMTGFGRAEQLCPATGIRYTAEISGVNRKQLDVRVSVAKELLPFEVRIRELVGRHISRGAVQVRIDFRQETAESASRIHIDTAVVRDLLKQSETLKTELGLTGELTLRDILGLPGIVTPVMPDLLSETAENAMLTCVETMLTAFNAMREREGQNLRADFVARLDKLAEGVVALRELTDRHSAVFRERIIAKIREAEVQFAADEERLVKEVFYLCMKADVAEELTRLESHIQQMRESLDIPQCGRKLDFIVQEMHREITTLGNKAPGVEITPVIVELKTEIDRMKEQVQNVE